MSSRLAHAPTGDGTHVREVIRPGDRVYFEPGRTID
jgi:hypothetical protein